MLIVASGAAGLLFDAASAVPMTAVLLLLGVGWNLGVVGGSALLAASVPAPQHALPQPGAAHENSLCKWGFSQAIMAQELGRYGRRR